MLMSGMKGENMNATLVVVVEGQAFRLQWKMLVEDKDAMQKALVSEFPENLEIKCRDVWCLVGTKAGGHIIITENEGESYG